MSNPKGQHYVPECYLKAFADPKSDPKKPFIWVFSKDGKQKRKQSPDKVFKKNDLYTIKIKGQKDYTIEEAIGEIESKYSEIFQKKIKNKLPLSDYEHLILCIFVNLMLQRTLRYKENLESFVDQLIEMTNENNANPQRISELNNYKDNIHKMAVSRVLTNPDITELLYHMNLAFLYSENNCEKFITSDDPCNLFNPDLRWQRFYSPGLGQKNIEVTLPLSPKFMLCMSRSNLRGYLRSDNERIKESNRFIHAHSNKEFISSSPKFKRYWLRNYPLDLFFILKIIVYKIDIFLYDIRSKYHRHYVRKR